MKRNLVMTLCAVIFISALFQTGFSAGGPYFSNCPVGKKLEVNLTYTENVEDQFSDRELEDQAKDWFLFGLLLNSGLKDGEVNEITYDLAPVRYDFLKPVFNFEYGETRSSFIGNREIVAIIPKCSPNERLDYLAHIADEHRKNQHEIPKKIYVFQYQIDLDDYFAIVTRLEDQNAELLFTPRYGYFQTTLKSLSDLKNFMSKTEDLTYAAITPDGEVEVGGRKLKGRHYGTITYKDVATIWQAESKLECVKEKVSNYWYDLYYIQERNEREKKYFNYAKELNYSRSIGFSLDPIYDYEAIIDLLDGDWDSYIKKIKNKKSPYLLDKIIKKPDFNRLQNLICKYGFNILEITEELKQKNASMMLDFLEELSIDNYNTGIAYLRLLNATQIQKARYCGDLEGTEVGMNFFYTDLLMKLWSINFHYSSPVKNIEDFHTDLNANLGKNYKSEFYHFPVVRSWLAPDNSKIRLLCDESKMFFPRNIVKIHSKSRSYFSLKETETIKFWRWASDWWNDHFEEVAEFEPEFERLNECLKWGAVTSWLNASGKLNQLEFLNNLTVKRDYWFPQWAKKNRDLKFQKWNRIEFFPKGFDGHPTETMAILSSPYFQLWGEEKGIRGGVTSISKESIDKLSKLGERFRKFKGAPKSEYAKFVDQRNIGVEINNIGKTRKIVRIDPPSRTNLRNSFCEFQNEDFIREITNKSGTFQIDSKSGKFDFARLTIDSSKNGFNGGLISSAVDEAYYVGRGVSRSSNPLEWLNNCQFVEDFQPLASGNGFLVKLKYSGKTIEIKILKNPSKKIPKGWDMRVSDTLLDSKIVDIRFEIGNANKVFSRPSRNPMTDLKRGVYKFEQGDFTSGNRNINNALKRLAEHRNVDSLSEFVNFIGKNKSLSSYQKSTFREFFEFHSFKRVKSITAKFKHIWGGSNISPKSFFKKRGPRRVIVQDHPSLNQFDFNVNTQKTIQQVLETYPGAIFKKIPVSKLKNYRIKVTFTNTPEIGYTNVFTLEESLKDVPFFLLSLCNEKESKEKEEDSQNSELKEKDEYHQDEESEEKVECPEEVGFLYFHIDN